MKLVVLTAFLGLAAFSAQGAAPDPSLYPKMVRPFFEKHCFDCHDTSQQKGGLNLETLKPSFTNRAEISQWTTIFDRMERGEMPPPKKSRPPEQTLRTAMSWVGLNIYDAETRRNAALGRTAWKRLSKAEYQNTIHDLFLIDDDVSSLLPDDSLVGGFDNVDTGLEISSMHMEKYLEAADAAIDAAYQKPVKPTPTTKRYTFQQEKAWPQMVGKHAVATSDAAVFFADGYPGKVIGEARVRTPGLYKFRISASAYQSKETMPYLAYIGIFFSANRSELQGVFDAPQGKPQISEFTALLRKQETIRIVPENVHKPAKEPADGYKGAGLAIQWIEVEGPLAPVWPPAFQTRLFGDVDPAKGTPADAEKILKTFMAHAFRRDLTPGEEKPYVGLMKGKFDAHASFEDALRVGLKAVLVSPDFLYFQAAPGKLDEFALASRLSYFLWSTMPDEILLAAARGGKLREAAVLRAQVERMLNDPKAAEFTENFTGQWLKLHDIKATTPDKKLYPEYNELLEWSMLHETHSFFDELLQHDLSVLNFVQSDFAMLNARTAKLYGIPGVDGYSFRKVPLKPEWHRGGVLTQAAVLKVTANGTNTSPVPRGVFFLNSILGRPVPPPPKNVPAIEPDTRGATTIREQLVKHRNVELCATCHNRIDPPGAALESFDVIGGWRENYRILGVPGNKRTPDPYDPSKPFVFGDGPKCETDGQLPGGRNFTNIDDFKKVALADPVMREQFARCITEKLLAYATGHSIEFADRAVVSQIVNDIRPKSLGLRSLVQAVIQSPTFQNK